MYQKIAKSLASIDTKGMNP